MPRPCAIAPNFLNPDEKSKLHVCPGGTCRAGQRPRRGAGVQRFDRMGRRSRCRPAAGFAGIDHRDFHAALLHGAAAAALPVHLTIKQAAGPLPARCNKHCIATNSGPCKLRRSCGGSDLLEAFDACPLPLDQVTDDVQLLELRGKPVWLVEGEERNLKITTPTDLQIAHALLSTI